METHFHRLSGILTSALHGLATATSPPPQANKLHYFFTSVLTVLRDGAGDTCRILDLLQFIRDMLQDGVLLPPCELLMPAAEFAVTMALAVTVPISFTDATARILEASEDTLRSIVSRGVQMSTCEVRGGCSLSSCGVCVFAHCANCPGSAMTTHDIKRTMARSTILLAARVGHHTVRDAICATFRHLPGHQDAVSHVVRPLCALVDTTTSPSDSLVMLFVVLGFSGVALTRNDIHELQLRLRVVLAGVDTHNVPPTVTSALAYAAASGLWARLLQVVHHFCDGCNCASMNTWNVTVSVISELHRLSWSGVCEELIVAMRRDPRCSTSEFVKMCTLIVPGR